MFKRLILIFNFLQGQYILQMHIQLNYHKPFYIPLVQTETINQSTRKDQAIIVCSIK